MTRIVLGCGNFGGIGSAPGALRPGRVGTRGVRDLGRAWDDGIRWFDTADAYGGGRSESAIGAWIRATGNRPRLTTKTYNPMDAGEDHGLAPDRILRQIETSLERLGVDRVDLYLAHEFDPETPYAESVGAYERLVEEGTIGANGVSNFDAAQLEEALAAGRPSLVQNSRTPSWSAATRTVSCRSAPSTGSTTRRSARSRAAGSPGSTGPARRIPRVRG